MIPFSRCRCNPADRQYGPMCLRPLTMAPADFRSPTATSNSKNGSMGIAKPRSGGCRPVRTTTCTRQMTWHGCNNEPPPSDQNGDVHENPLENPTLGFIIYPPRSGSACFGAGHCRRDFELFGRL